MRPLFKTNIKMNKIEEDEENIESWEVCWLCEQKFLIKNRCLFFFVDEKLKQKKLRIDPDWVRRKKWEIIVK